MPTECTGCCPIHKHRNVEEVRNRFQIYSQLHVQTLLYTGPLLQFYSPLSQGCGYSTDPEKDRPVQENARPMTHTTHKFGKSQRDPFQTHRRRWRLLQKTHLPALKDRVRCLVFQVLCWCFGFDVKDTLKRLMVTLAGLQGCGMPNQWTRNRVKLSLRYHISNILTNQIQRVLVFSQNTVWFLPAWPLKIKEKQLLRNLTEMILRGFSFLCSSGFACGALHICSYLIFSVLSPAADGPLKQHWPLEPERGTERVENAQSMEPLALYDTSFM